MTASRSKTDPSRSSRARGNVSNANLPPKKETGKSKDALTKSENTKKDEVADDNKSDESDGLNLGNNPDYIALSSALSLLEAQKQTASNDIKTLQELKKTAIENPQATLRKLRESGTLERIPKPQKVVKAPVIPWSKYGISAPQLKNQLEQGVVDSSTPVGAVRLFEDSYGERQREKWNV